MPDFIWFLIIAIPVIAFLIHAQKRRWIDFRGTGGFASLTAMHDLQTQDKQDAIEYVIEEKGEKKMEEQESGSPVLKLVDRI